MYRRGRQITEGICDSTAALVLEAERKAVTYRDIANSPTQAPPNRAVRQDWPDPPAHFHLAADMSSRALKAMKEIMLLDREAASCHIS